MPLAHADALQKGYLYHFSEAEAFEYAVLEYPFAFWQYGSGDCAPLPAVDATARELFYHLVAVSPLSYYSDADYEYFRPLFYQAYTEIGYCPYVFDHLAGLLQAVPAPDYRAFAPRVVPLTFRPEVMAAIVPGCAVGASASFISTAATTRGRRRRCGPTRASTPCAWSSPAPTTASRSGTSTTRGW